MCVCVCACVRLRACDLHYFDNFINKNVFTLRSISIVENSYFIRDENMLMAKVIEKFSNLG